MGVKMPTAADIERFQRALAREEERNASKSVEKKSADVEPSAASIEDVQAQNQIDSVPVEDLIETKASYPAKTKKRSY